MSLSILISVLLAAFCHASWNALVKFGNDRFFGLVMIAVFSGILTIPALFWFGLPAPEAVPWLVLSVLFHLGYIYFLSQAYNHGDLSQIYPISRGSAPLITALLSVVLFHEVLPILSFVGILLIISGVVAIAFAGRKFSLNIKGKALVFALCTAFFTACYTLSDGYGARASQDPVTYTLWLFLLNGLILAVPGAIKYRSSLLDGFQQYWRSGLLGGLMQLISYGIAIWAMSQAPIVLVAAIRETSVLFAMFLSIVFLKEKFNLMRVFACIVILLGVLLAKLAS
ncbi:EamA family transporter [Providencia rustigianii]|uniref:Membrane protein n=1 Tax=Providencia rustigianii DSM 4541 TaxID=500637 RepID=D1P6P5_9GAMM|nr:EamA family transporter [Providencia rustigianii]EFB70967.1 putative membrane protein [Providencia rustigianii DSM 4541]MTC60251.1 EamA family transporter [Providencia rustigianii]SUC25763.1 Membrane transporters of cations and cationic drugs [Providencia rustigianii]VEH53978.1 Membrane transporters of cations and cationic drugs [Providencia rustigianii]